VASPRRDPPRGPSAPLTTTAIGRAAERRVGEWLEARGRVVLGRNVRFGRDEIDILALDGRTVVLVEVRTRADDSRGHPLETIDRRKRDHLRRAAKRYAQRNGVTDVRIDVACVMGDEIDYVENAVDFTST